MAPKAAVSTVALSAVDESLVGVQAPAGFYDPLGLVEKDGEDAFIRRRAVERKHGRVAMAGITGCILHNANVEFPGYLSKSANLKFSDVPNGFKGIFAVPPAGLAQILVFVGLVELAWWPANNYSGDYGCGFFGATYEGEEKVKKRETTAYTRGRFGCVSFCVLFFPWFPTPSFSFQFPFKPRDAHPSLCRV